MKKWAVCYRDGRGEKNYFTLQAETVVWEKDGPRFYIGDQLVGGVNEANAMWVQCNTSRLAGEVDKEETECIRNASKDWPSE